MIDDVKDLLRSFGCDERFLVVGIAAALSAYAADPCTATVEALVKAFQDRKASNKSGHVAQPNAALSDDESVQDDVEDAPDVA